MDYKKFLYCFSNVKDFNLSGKLIDAQLTSFKKIYSKNDPGLYEKSTKAGVMLLCYPKQNAMHLSLIKRSEYNGVHSGQISFPGGKKEEQDISIWNTALRECNEELGTSLAQKSLHLSLSPIYIPISNFLVSPFVLAEPKYPIFKINKREVYKHLELPLDRLLDFTIEDYVLDSGPASGKIVPSFVFDNYIIWGATAMILLEFKIFLESHS